MPEVQSQTLSEDEARLVAGLNHHEHEDVRKACPPHEQRRFKRHEFFGTLTIRLRLPDDQLSPAITVHGRDISLGGVKFASSIELTPKAKLEICFQLTLWGSRRFLRMLAEVRHTRQDEEGQWITGCQFLDTLSAWPR